MQIALLHTADVHATTFDQLFETLGVDANITHCVRPDLLKAARRSGLTSIQDETVALLNDMCAADAVICTCSTLGPIADQVAQSAPHVFRIDRPMMEKACETGTDILIAICLESTRDATLELLQQCAMDLGRTIRPRVILCANAWPFFEAGDMDRYAAEIAAAIARDVGQHARTDCIVLAQASMATAAGLLNDTATPVMSSPAMAASHAVALAERR